MSITLGPLYAAAQEDQAVIRHYIGQVALHGYIEILVGTTATADRFQMMQIQILLQQPVAHPNMVTAVIHTEFMTVALAHIHTGIQAITILNECHLMKHFYRLDKILQLRIVSPLVLPSIVNNNTLAAFP